MRTVDPAALLRVPADSSRPGSTVRIGVSGNRGGHTRELCAGVAAALERRNAAPDVPYPVELVWREDSFEPSETVRAAEHLVAQGCTLVVGHLSSSAALPAAAVYARAGVPFLAPGTTNLSLTERGDRNVLRFCGRDDALAAEIAGFVARRGWARPVLAVEDIVYGRALGALIERALAERGPRVTATIVVREGEPVPPLPAECDVVILAGRYQRASELLDAMTAARAPAAAVLGDDAFIPDLLRHDGRRGPETYVVSTASETGGPHYADFHRRYVARAGSEPGAYAATSHAATELALAVLDESPSPGPGEFLAALRARAWTHPSVLGPLRFDERGDIERFPWCTYRVRGRHFVPTTHLAEV